MKKNLNIRDYTYSLPPERIALYPLQHRDQSKLLIYNKGVIQHEQFSNIGDYLPPNTSLFFNDTKVIPARLYFQKDTGAEIEIFLLHPIHPSSLLLEAMNAIGTATWKCTIGNLKRWKSPAKLFRQSGEFTLEAELLDRDEGIVKFLWDGNYSFAEILTGLGETPLPPYLRRKAEGSDRERYQTIYSHYEGAVAAPTAGLHFTENVLNILREKNFLIDFLTLHVSAGTFQPVKTEDAAEHVMHQEQIIISKRNLENILHHERFIVPVGTTSMRTLESVYWFGCKLLKDPGAGFTIGQDEPYGYPDPYPTKKEAIQAVLNYMEQKDTDTLAGETSIYIIPGYTFRVCNGLITNFHQPGSTLLLLVAAFIGEDWKKIYTSALENDYRFLSYGDSSLLLP